MVGGALRPGPCAFNMHYLSVYMSMGYDQLWKKSISDPKSKQEPVDWCWLRSDDTRLFYDHYWTFHSDLQTSPLERMFWKPPASNSQHGRQENVQPSHPESSSKTYPCKSWRNELSLCRSIMWHLHCCVFFIQSRRQQAWLATFLPFRCVLQTVALCVLIVGAPWDTWKLRLQWTLSIYLSLFYLTDKIHSFSWRITILPLITTSFPHSHLLLLPPVLLRCSLPQFPT